MQQIQNEITNDRQENYFSSVPLEQLRKNKEYLEDIKNQILLKSKTDVWRKKGEPNFNYSPYAEWRRGNSCCSIM